MKTDQGLEPREPEVLPIKEAAAALVYNTLGLDVYCLQWKFALGCDWESFFIDARVPLIISEKVH